MSKFVINCPVCNRPVEASTGPFAKKTIKCACGYTIDVNASKYASKTCPHCGQTVTYDRSNEKKAVCPNCHKAVHYGTREEKVKYLRPLYDARIAVLKKLGIDIDFDVLIDDYYK